MSLLDNLKCYISWKITKLKHRLQLNNRLGNVISVLIKKQNKKKPDLIFFIKTINLLNSLNHLKLL